MQKIENYIRGWLAISFIQQCGLILQHIRDPNILQQIYSPKVISRDVLAGYLFVILCLQHAILKCLLLFNNHNKLMHIYNIIINVIHLLYHIWIIIYQQFSIDLLSQIGFSSITIVLTLSYIFCNDDFSKDSTPITKNTRKLISKHFLEAHVRDYDPHKNKND